MLVHRVNINCMRHLNVFASGGRAGLPAETRALEVTFVRWYTRVASLLIEIFRLA